MTATNPIRVVQWGLGAMGQGMAKLITAKDGLELVGAIDVNPALDGKDIGEVLGIDPLGANVTTDPRLHPRFQQGRRRHHRHNLVGPRPDRRSAHHHHRWHQRREHRRRDVLS